MSLKQQALRGVFWTYLQQFGSQAIGFTISLVLARLLLPEEFGIIALLTVFVALSNTIINSGLNQALIQQKEVDALDYASVFYLNLILAGLMYGVLYLTAPLIADFYKEPELILLTRVLGLGLFLSSFGIIQSTRLTRELDFKTQMLVALPSQLLAGLAGVVMAYNGYSYWSLVVQQLLSQALVSAQLWWHSGWVPGWQFSWGRLRSLFRFGSRLMLSALLNTIFENLYTVLIGRFFTTAEVGFYSRANSTKQLPVSSISSALNKVTFPVFSRIQDDDERLRGAYRRIMEQVLFWVAPLLIGAGILGEPLFRFLFTEKWLPAVPMFQVLCVTGIMFPLNAYNLNILNVKGRSDLFLRLEVIKKVLVSVGLIISVPYGVMAMLYAQAIISVLAYGINSYYSGRFIQYPMWAQLRDLLPIFLNALLMGGIVLFLHHYISIENDFLTIVSLAVIGVFVYFAGAIVFRLAPIQELRQLWKQNRLPKS